MGQIRQLHKNLNEKNREIRKKKEIKDYIIYANSSNMNNSTIKISDGKLKLTEVKQTAPLNLKYIEKCFLNVLVIKIKLIF